MKVDKFDFAVPDLMSKRKDFANYFNSMLEVLEDDYSDFVFKRDNGFIEDIDIGSLLLAYSNVTCIVDFMAEHGLLKRHAFERLELFTDKIFIDIQDFENLYGGNYV